MRVLRFDSIDSTSSEARRVVEADPGAAPLVVVARTQSAGRGQLGRAWSSPEGGLWCTFAWPGAGVSHEGLGLRIGVACARTVEGALRRAGNGSDVRLKWPNDIHLSRKKVLGVLTESIGAGDQRFVLIGVGINANFALDQLPPEVAALATTLRERTGSVHDLEQLLGELTANLERVLRMPRLDAATLAEARFRLDGVGREAEVRTGDATVRGILLGLGEDGMPLVRTGG